MLYKWHWDTATYTHGRMKLASFWSFNSISRVIRRGNSSSISSSTFFLFYFIYFVSPLAHKFKSMSFWFHWLKFVQRKRNIILKYNRSFPFFITRNILLAMKKRKMFCRVDLDRLIKKGDKIINSNFSHIPSVKPLKYRWFQNSKNMLDNF